MQNSFRIRTQSEIKQFLSDQNYQKKDFFIDLISPWNHSQNPNKTSFLSTKKNINDKNKTFTNQDGENFHIKKIINQRIKTQGSKDSKMLRQKHIINFNNQKNHFMNNFFSTLTSNQNNRFLNTPLKKSRKLPSRRKFTTPIVNINEYTFLQSRTQPLIKIQQVLIPKQRINNRSEIKTSLHHSIEKERSNNNSTSYMKRRKTFNMKKLSTQKNLTITTTQNFDKKLNFQILNMKTGHGTVMENLKKLTEFQSRPTVKQLKSKSFNKFNKTFY